MCPLLTKETVLGRASLEDGATVEGPALTLLPHSASTRNR